MNSDEYFNNLDPPVREIAIELRKLVRETCPNAVEELKWGVPTYGVSRSFCSIMAHKAHVNLQLFQGAHLAETEGLVGTGKDMRHLKFSKISELNAELVRRYLEQAVEFDEVHT